jgi:bile acid-coenzyme A ligase
MAGVISLGEGLALRAASSPRETALVWIGDEDPQVERRFDWFLLDRRVTQVAHLLKQKGVQEGNVVAVALGNTPEHVLVGFAAWRLGAGLLPIDPGTGPDSREQILSSVRPAVLVTDWEKTKGISSAEIESSITLAASPLPNLTSSPGRLIATGGSTGEARVIVSNQPWVYFPGELSEARVVGVRVGQRRLVAGPIHHSAYFELAYRGMLISNYSILLESFSAEKAVGAIEGHKIEFALFTPTMMQWIAALPGIGVRNLDSLETVLHTGGPCPTEVKQWWIDRIHPHRVYEMYGSTEGLGRTVITGEEWLKHPGSVGRPLDSEMRILDETHQEVSRGVVGEVFMRRLIIESSRVQFRAGKRMTSDGFASIGDLGWMDGEGYLYLNGRVDDVILSGGANVYPAEIEKVLLNHELVDDAVVVGSPDRALGQRIHAILQLKAQADPIPDAELWAFCRQQLSTEKSPHTFEFVKALPRKPTGKIRRRELMQERGWA